MDEKQIVKLPFSGQYIVEGGEPSPQSEDDSPYAPDPSKSEAWNRDKRRLDVAWRDQYFDVKPQALAEKWGVSTATINSDLRFHQDEVHATMSRSISAMREKEGVFLMEQRRICDTEARQATASDKSIRWRTLALEYAKEFFKLFGLYAPQRNLNMNLDLNALMKENGVSEIELARGLVQETANMIESLKIPREELEPLIRAIKSAPSVVESDPVTSVSTESVS